MDPGSHNPALPANAELFKRLQGRRVRTVLKLLRTDGNTLQGQSPDGQTVTVNEVVKSEEFTSFVEVIGVVQSDLSLLSHKLTNFGDNFDMSNFNGLCLLANGAQQEIFL